MEDNGYSRVQFGNGREAIEFPSPPGWGAVTFSSAVIAKVRPPRWHVAAIAAAAALTGYALGRLWP